MKYYIQNRDSGFLGNSLFFWALNSNGYTAKLEKAHQFTFEEAKEICEGNPHKNKAWEVEYIDNNIGTTRVTDSQNLKKENIIDFSKSQKTKKNNYILPELKEDRFVQGYICAVCCMINMDGIVETRTKEMYRAGVGQMTYGALEKRGVPKNDLDVLQQFWNELH